MGYFMDPSYMLFNVLALALSGVGWLVQNRLQSKFKKYSLENLSSGRTGKEIAERMLHYYGIQDVQVLSSEGFLSDHYDSAKKTVNLSPEVFNSATVSSAAVAAHECGHAVQHATSYAMLQVRNAIVPVVRVASMLQQYLLIFAFMLANTFPSLLLVTIMVFMITTFFSLITLPVEFDASHRALVWLNETGEVKETEYVGAKDALKWAAMTYVAQALSALVMLIFLALRYLGASRN
ncbi:MAG: zinc metallopeptidase [Saprospiraceae bacterium]